ncbi:MAG TPA: CoA transferase, partial [Candidatus Limnocylindrales bacterium]|nr:CoA transferase [Candidatus Limnocylindrales bacterium]
MEAPLEGIRVLDVSRVLAGPFCSMLLGDMGADVVKVERVGRGDDSRSVGEQVAGESTYFLTMNRNKRGVTLDFRDPEGRELLRRLAGEADVLIENFRAGTMDAMGLGWETLHEVNPRLIMASISGFGQSGPYVDYAAFDMIVQAMSGMMDMTGEPDRPPVTTGTFLIDYATGLYTAFGILGALRARDRTGRGQHLDMALLDTAFSFLVTAIPDWLLLHRRMERRGNRDRYCAPTNLFTSKDGRYVFVAAATDGLFPRLAKVIGREDMLTDPRYATNVERMKRIEETEQILGAWVAERTADEVVALVRGAGLPCAKVATIDEVVEDPQIRHRDMLVEVDHPTVGSVPMHGLNVRFSETREVIRRPPPLLGQHNEEVYGEWLGMPSDEVAALAERGVI